MGKCKYKKYATLKTIRKVYTIKLQRNWDYKYEVCDKDLTSFTFKSSHLKNFRSQ